MLLHFLLGEIVQDSFSHFMALAFKISKMDILCKFEHVQSARLANFDPFGHLIRFFFFLICFF